MVSERSHDARRGEIERMAVNAVDGDPRPVTFALLMLADYMEVVAGSLERIAYPKYVVTHTTKDWNHAARLIEEIGPAPTGSTIDPEQARALDALRATIMASAGHDHHRCPHEISRASDGSLWVHDNIGRMRYPVDTTTAIPI
jgi:hypothetical protein